MDFVPSKVSWMWRRLQAMSLQEIAYRANEALSQRRRRESRIKSPQIITESSLWRPVPGFASREDYAKHLLHRDREVFYRNMETVRSDWKSQYPDAPSGMCTQADRILAHEYPFLGHGWIALDGIDWHRDPLSGNCWPRLFAPELEFRNRDDIGEVRILWELNRHHHLVWLAQAYRMSGDIRYVNRLIEQFDSWCQENPLEIGVNWVSPMESAIRVHSWTWICALLHGSTEFFEFVGRLVQAIRQHVSYVARHRARFSSANNHLLVEASSMVVAGLYFHEWPEAERWVTNGFGILADEVSRQIYPDGVNAEQATHYQAFVMETLFLTGLLARRAGREGPPVIEYSLEAMCDFIAHLTDGHGGVLEFGDSDDGHIVRLGRSPIDDYGALLALGAVMFDRGDWKTVLHGELPEQSWWLLGQDGTKKFASLEAQEAFFPSKAFEAGGYVVFRDKESEGVLLFDCGPLGFGSLAAHGHADALNVLLNVQGHPVLVDSGTFIYNVETDWRNHFRKTKAHNTATVDGKDQSPMAGPFLWSRHADTVLVENVIRPLVSYAESYHAGYAPVKHCRRVVQAGSGTWIIIDEFTGTRAPHLYEVSWHLHPDTVCETRAVNSLTLQHRRLKVQFVTEPGVSPAVENTQFSPEFGRRVETRVIRCRQESAQPWVCSTILTLNLDAEVHYIKKGWVEIQKGGERLISIVGPQETEHASIDSQYTLLKLIDGEVRGVLGRATKKVIWADRVLVDAVEERLTLVDSWN